MNQDTLHELFVEQIRDIYDAEKQLVKALPKLVKAVQSDDLAEALRSHLVETETHVTRLEEVFGMLEMTPKAKPCKAMKGLIAEGGEAAKEEKGALRDLAIIAGGQRVEHYEISAYGTARTLAEYLGLSQAAELLQQTENEEKKADSTLTDVATTIYQSVEDESLEDEGDEADGELETVSAGAGSGSSSARSAASKRNGKTSR
jgi:ferritin-like metal-binding protein YciE